VAAAHGCANAAKAGRREWLPHMDVLMPRRQDAEWLPHMDVLMPRRQDAESGRDPMLSASADRSVIPV